ncbi:uncharacterized protein LOC114333134 [Diabrotica virgifera virgifera]|uniref:Uncharacterized protein LOC114333134 n=1 Tax=Diabrotica virgifera virgifera TaxID=50390 RepID=A0A6P7FQZ4_DIAVI|nr:uncharacterized protein LOC114333134 [Diabrotica virgifera virgifera]
MKCHVFAVLLVFLNFAAIWPVEAHANDDFLRALIVNLEREKLLKIKEKYQLYDDGLPGGYGGLNGYGGLGVGGVISPYASVQTAIYRPPQVGCRLTYGQRICPPYY